MSKAESMLSRSLCSGEMEGTSNDIKRNGYRVQTREKTLGWVRDDGTREQCQLNRTSKGAVGIIRRLGENIVGERENMEASEAQRCRESWRVKPGLPGL